MNPTIDILRAELERLFSLEEMTSMSQRLLGLNPGEVGGATAKASFAKALTERCVDGDRIDALVDVILISRQGVDPRVRDVAGLYGREELAPGKALGPFVVLKKLGDSELSTVYLTRRGDEERVLKVLKHEACRNRRAVQRLLTANRLVASVEHPGLPKGIDAGETDGVYWISYLHVDAQTLSARFARTGPSHINELKPTLQAILEPLAALHQARIVHGDLKLENVLVGRSAEGGLRVTLIDFGTDRLRQRPTVANGHTGVLAVIGSPKTIAPEQVRGLRADPASDVYSFGAMMFELLSGKPVFAFENATDAAFAHVSAPPEPPSTKAPRGWVTRDVDQFVLSLLAKDPARRPKDAAAVLDQLESLGSAVRPARRPGRVLRGPAGEPHRAAARRPRRRRGRNRARGRRRAGRRRDQGGRGLRPGLGRGGPRQRGRARGQEGPPLSCGAHLRHRGEGQGARGACVRPVGRAGW